MDILHVFIFVFVNEIIILAVIVAKYSTTLKISPGVYDCVYVVIP